MGEYANYKGQQIKIGTCETMHYLRYQDRNKVRPAVNENGLFFRLPYPEEDEIKPGEYTYPAPGVLLSNYDCAELAENPGNVQLKHEFGLLISIPCYHGIKLPDLGTAKVFWNGRCDHISLMYLKSTSDGCVPVIQCRSCQQMWSTTWAEVLPYLADSILKRRLAIYADTGKGEIYKCTT